MVNSTFLLRVAGLEAGRDRVQRAHRRGRRDGVLATPAGFEGIASKRLREATEGAIRPSSLMVAVARPYFCGVIVQIGTVTVTPWADLRRLMSCKGNVDLARRDDDLPARSSPRSRRGAGPNPFFRVGGLFLRLVFAGNVIAATLAWVIVGIVMR
jgi:hypothetical protein